VEKRTMSLKRYNQKPYPTTTSVLAGPRSEMGTIADACNARALKTSGTVAVSNALIG
jgi:hypothetical protein